VAPLLFSPGDDVFQEQFANTPAPVLLSNYQVLHQSPGGGAMGKVGYDEKHHGAHNLALVFSNKEFMSGVSANLSEHLSVVIVRRAPAHLNSREADSQFMVEIEDAGNILLGSQSDIHHVL